MGTNGSIPSTLASLILIDRQLDIVTPALHQSHVLDRIFGSLPARGSSTHVTSQSASGGTSHTAPDQQDQSPVHEVVSTRKHLREAGAEADAGAVPAAESDTEVEARADGGSSKTEGVSEAADGGSLEAADNGASGSAKEGWSDLEDASESELGGPLQHGAAGLVHQLQQQEQQRQQHLQQPQQPQRTMSSLRLVLQASRCSD